MPVRAIRSRAPPPSMVHHSEIASAQRRQRAGQRRLRGDGEDQARQQRAQVALRRQHQQPAGAAARQDHARCRTARRRWPRRTGCRAPRSGVRRWRRTSPASASACVGQHRGGEGEQPHRELAAREVARELDHRRAQAEARALRHEAEDHADQQRRPACQRPVSPSLSIERLAGSSQLRCRSGLDVGGRRAAAWRCAPRPRA